MSQLAVSNYLNLRPNSSTFLDGQKKLFESFLNELESIENSRKDITVQVKDLEPIDLSERGNWIVGDEKGNSYRLNDQAIGQLGAKRKTAALTRAYIYSSPDEFKTTDINGMPVTINFRDVAFRQAMQSRPKSKAVFREALTFDESDNYREVKGVVSESYPLDFSDVQAIRGILEFTEQAGISTKPTHFSYSPNGTVVATMIFDDDDFRFVSTVNDREIDEQFGLGIKDNLYGDGAFTGFGYKYTQICTNGMMGWGLSSTLRVVHATRKSFVKSIIDLISGIERRDGYKSFVEYYGVDDVVLSLDYYLGDINRIYPILAAGMVYKAIESSETLKAKYKKAIKTVVKSWEKEIEAQAKKYSIPKTQISTLKDIALRDETIGLELKGAGSLYDISAVMTSAANVISGEHGIYLQEVAGQVLTSPPLTPLLKVAG